ncbi:histidine phosphatase family protein [Sporosarcina sp. YIM B06819]|uniref:histidine phosphatase family protein n=1 Tax=Sporosarcina sp. YIM B06819 TaxID=3081769 RepID=UPI00298CFDEC|nr:histidine phosphatase family protein [Sporosarcina sp. YIM B06819]
MEKIIYIVRHCSAEGQPPHADLTAEGVLQAGELAKFFDGIEIDCMITSPFKRALRTAWPIAERKKLHVQVDSRLTERVLSSRDLEDWLVKLEDTFSDLHLKYEGGESSGEAMSRACNVVDELGDGSRTVLVTHGNLMTLLLKHYDKRFDFERWQALSNPDVYRVQITDDEADVKRIWN